MIIINKSEVSIKKCDKQKDQMYNLIGINQSSTFTIKLNIPDPYLFVFVKIITFTSQLKAGSASKPFKFTFKDDLQTLPKDQNVYSITNSTNYCTDQKEDIYEMNYLVSNKKQSGMFELQGTAKAEFSALHSISISYYKCYEGCQSCEFVPTDKNSLDGKGQQICRSCKIGYYLSNYVCIPFCPDDTTSLVANCITCTNNCKDCGQYDKKLEEQATCFTCKDGYKLTKSKDCIENYDRCINRECTACKKNYQKLGNICRDKCPIEYYPEDNICKKCMNNCLSCNQIDSCKQCHQKYFYNNNSCELCSKYIQGCDKCTDKSKCITCQKDYYLIEGQCQKYCPLGFFGDNVSRQCLKCSQESCLKCENSSLFSCLICDNSSYLDLNQCVSNCSPTNKKKCFMCHISCESCDGQGEDDCIKCAPGFKKYQQKCLINCPDFTYPDETKQLCIDCNDKQYCKQCNSAKKCIECTQNRKLDQGECVLDIKSCEANYYFDIQKQECQQCTIDNQSDKCIKPCPTAGQTYNKYKKMCQQCQNEDCKNCLIMDQNVNQQEYCIKCNQNFFLQRNKCVENNCSEGFYLDQQNKKCIECYDKHCKSCSSSINLCNSCMKGYHLYDYYCIQLCPQNYFSENQICTQCDENKYKNCQKCEIYQSGSCIKCQEAYFLYNGKCKLSCPDNLFPNEKLGKCEECNSRCIRCSQNYFLIDGNCLSECPQQNYYFEQSNDVQKKNICKKCPKNCQKCKLNDGKLYCIQCENNFYEEKGQCKEACSKGLFKKDGACLEDCPIKDYKDTLSYECISCFQNCDTCKLSNSINTCLKCSSNFFLQNGSCFNKCQEGFKSDPDNNCIDCSLNNSGPCLKITYYIQDNSNNTISVIFKEEINNLQNYIQNMQLSFDEEKNKFPFTASILQHNQILIQFTVNKNPDKNSIKLKVEFKDHEKLQLSSPNAIQNVKLIYQTSQSNKAASEGIKSATKAATSVAVASLLPLAISGQFQFIASAIDVSQLIYLMGFVNLKSPFNVSAFFNALKDFKLPSKNYFEMMHNYDKIEYDAPKKFEDKEISGFFLENAGDSISLILTIVIVHIVLLILSKLTSKFKKFSAFLKSTVVKVLSYSFYVDLLWGIYLDFILSIFLQLTGIEVIDYSEEIVNYTFFALTFIPMIFPFIIYEFIRRNIYPQLTAIFLQDLNYKYFQIVLYTRKLVMGFIIVVFQFQLDVQISLLVTWHIFMTILIYIKKPYIKNIDNIRNFLQGILFMTGTSLLFALQIFDDEEEKKVLIGWIIILFFGLIIVIELGFFLKDTILMINQKRKDLIQYLKSRRRNKIVPLKENMEQKDKQQNVNEEQVKIQEIQQTSKIIPNKNTDIGAPVQEKKSRKRLRLDVKIKNLNSMSAMSMNQSPCKTISSKQMAQQLISSNDLSINKDELNNSPNKINSASVLESNTLLFSTRDLLSQRLASKKVEVKSFTNFSDSPSKNDNSKQANEQNSQLFSYNIQNHLESNLQCFSSQDISELPSPVPLSRRIRSNISDQKKEKSYLLNGIKLNIIKK